MFSVSKYLCICSLCLWIKSVNTSQLLEIGVTAKHRALYVNNSKQTEYVMTDSDTRPPLADDDFLANVYNPVDAFSSIIFSKNDIPSHSAKYIVEKYQSYLGNEKHRVMGKRPSLSETKSVLDSVWEMYTKGSLAANEKDQVESSFSRASDIWRWLKSEISLKSVLEIGGCHLASRAADKSPKATVVAHTFDESMQTSCPVRMLQNLCETTSSKILFNAKLSQLYTNYKLLFDHIILTNFADLSATLLPHEYIQNLAMIFSMANVVFIPKRNLTKTQELYLLNQWSSPGALFNAVCEKNNILCGVEMLWGLDTWEYTSSIYKITVKMTKRTLPHSVCQPLFRTSKCFGSYNATSMQTILFSNDGKNITSPVHVNEIHLRTVLDMGTTRTTTETMFVKLLHQVQNSLWETDDLYLRGRHIVMVTSDENGRQQKQSPERSFNSIPRTKQLFRQGFNPSAKRHATGLYQNWERESLNTKVKSVQEISNGWDRETKGIVKAQHDESQIMEREVKESDSSKENFENSKSKNHVNVEELKDLTDEEKEVQLGLQLLREQRVENKHEKKINSAHTVLNSRKQKETNKNIFLKGDNLQGRNQHLNVKTSSTLNVMQSKDNKVSNPAPTKLIISDKDTSAKLKNRGSLPLKVAKSLGTDRKLGMTERRQTFSPHNSLRLLDVLINKAKQANAVDDSRVVQNNQRHLLSYPQSSSNSFTGQYRNFRRKRKLYSESNVKKTSVFSEKETVETLTPEYIHYSDVDDKSLFDSQWKVMTSTIAEAGDLNVGFSIFIFGQGHQRLTGNKVALLYPKATVVMVVPVSQSHLQDEFRKMSRSLPYKNSFVFSSDLHPKVVSELYKLPQLFQYQILGLDVFRPMLSLGDTFAFYLGQLLTLSETTFLELPSMQQLQKAQSVFTSTPVSVEGLIMNALTLVGATAETIKPLKVFIQEDFHSVLLMIKLKNMQRKVITGCDGSSGVLSLLSDGSVSLHMASSEVYHGVLRAKTGVGLKFLMNLGLNSADRSTLFQEYLKLPVYDDMCPEHIVWRNQCLLHQPVTESTESLNLHGQSLDRSSEITQKSLNMFAREIDNTSFSFMDYNSHDSLSMDLALMYPDSTFVGLLASSDKIPLALQRRKDKNITNIVLNVVSPDETLTRKLLKCPDFLRYQYIDYEEVLRQMRVRTRDSWNLFIGQAIATSVTTFIQVPSSKILSLAKVTLFPEHVTVSVENQVTHNYSNVFLSKNHPFPEFKDAENSFLFESAHADVDIEIAAKVLEPTVLSDGAQLPWKLVRVDVKKLHVKVDHHFDYSVDGHSRKYNLTCIGHNKTSYEVYLVRNSDGFKIPYGNVNAVSLIALLRMGLEKSIKEDFYSQFLKLPLYEDMAPWNIVFRAGKLDYIDYDSKDVTFNKMSKAAYQIMAMLMNYKRTITDFGRCEKEAKTIYGFSLVSQCVGSNFDGPCKDVRYPVPCGDHTCRATYIDCLQALQDLENKKSKGVKSSHRYLQVPVKTKDYDTWVCVAKETGNGHSAGCTCTVVLVGEKKIIRNVGAETMRWSFNIDGPADKASKRIKPENV